MSPAESPASARSPAPKSEASEAGEATGQAAHAALAVRGVSKAFGRIRVLHRVSMELKAGEVHVLAGENGAGKSTLVKILSGALSPDEGAIVVGGKAARFASPIEAANGGVATIHQELSLVGCMSVADNLFLAQRPRGRAGLFSPAPRRARVAEAERVLQGFGLDIDPDCAVAELPISMQQLVEIARALAAGARVLLLDEPTSALDERDAASLLERVRAIREAGAAVLYISHRMEEIYAVADRITVLRDGEVAGSAAARDLPRQALIAWMVGKELAASASVSASVPASVSASVSVALKVDRLRVASPAVPGRFDVLDASFSLQKGEILGLMALRGGGASQLLRALFGASGPPAGGSVELDGAPISIENPSASLRRGIALLTNDRKSAGLVMDLSVTENATLASLQRFSPFGLSFLGRAAERAAALDVTRLLRLRAPSLDAPVSALSGGNQQKVYLARLLIAEPRVLLLDEPTRGVDIAAKADIYEFIRGLAARGVSVIFASSEMEELLALAHRILVLHRGSIVLEEPRASEATRERLLKAAMGHASPENTPNVAEEVP